MPKDNATHVRRFKVGALPEAGGTLRLPADATRHVRVLRLRAGSTVRLFDGRGNEALARIAAVKRDEVLCEVAPKRVAREQLRRVTLVQALPKGPKLDSIVRMTTELGVQEIHLALSARSVPRLSESRASTRLQRLRRVAEEACAQSGQPHVPALLAPAPLSEAAARAPRQARRIVFWERASQDLRTALFGSEKAKLRTEEDIWVVVGPEGGLSAQEVGELAEQRYRAVCLGPYAMRVETAAAVAVGLALHLLGRLGPNP